MIWNATERTVTSCPISKPKTAHFVCEKDHTSLRKDSLVLQEYNVYIPPNLTAEGHGAIK